MSLESFYCLIQSPKYFELAAIEGKESWYMQTLK